MNPHLRSVADRAHQIRVHAWLIVAAAALFGGAELGDLCHAMPQAASDDVAPVEPDGLPGDETAPRPDSKPGDASEALASEESLARFQQLLEKRPFHGPAFTSLVSHYVERGKLNDLVAEYAAKVEALPDSLPHRIVLARLHLRAGDAEKAAAIIEKIEQLPPDLARLASELLVFKSEVYQRVGNNQAAERMLKQALEQARSVSEQLKLGEALADLYLREKRPDDAAAALRTLGEKFPGQYLHQKHIADALAQRGLHEQAIEHYRAILPLVEAEVDKKCEVLRQLGMSLEKINKRDDAIAAYVQAIGMLASDHWLQRELHERIVSLYRASGRLDDLAKYCQDQIARAPEQTAMRILLADVQSAMSQTDAAKATLEEAVTLFPADQTLSQKRIEFLERSGDIENASAEYQRIIGRHPDDPELYIGYGQFLANNRQVEAARNQWRHVLQTKVTDAMLASRLGSLFETYELYDDAAEAYERAIALSPQQPEGYVSLSRLWLIRGDKEKAIAALQRAADANPNDGPIHAALAQAMLNLGMAERALEAIGRACEVMPDQVRFHQMRSDLLVQNGRMEEALEVRRNALDLMTNPVQQAEAINILVSMHATANRLHDLKQREQERLAKDEQDTVSLLILARAADTERDLQGERAWLDQLLRAQPNNEIALQQLAKLQDAVGDVDASVATYQRLIELHPARGRQYYESIVDLKLRYGDKSGAIDTLDRMVKNDPGNANVLSAVAEQLVRMGDPELALDHFEKGLQLQPDRHDMRLDYGKALVDAGRLEDAMQAFRMVSTQRTDTDRAIEALGKLHDTATQLGSLEELIDELQTQVQTDPENTLVARALAALLIKEFEYGRAMELLNLVLKHNPRDVDIALARAELLRRLAQFDEAIAAYQQIVRFPQIDRDYVLGELGKAYFESGQVDQARRLWKQIQHKLYAGSLLKNNGLLEEAIAVLEEGIRLKPDDYALHRNLIGALDAAGKTDEALNAARRLLDLEPGNTYNIEGLAKAYLKNNNRAGAAEVAGRLFSAGVAADKSGQGGGSSPGRGGFPSLMAAMSQSMSSGYAGYYGGTRGRSNLEKGIEFFRENGLVGELEEVLSQQLKAQPDNSVLKNAAAELFASEFGKPELALKLLQELETAPFPLEHQKWLGQCSQRDFMRVQQYNLIASMPALRDQKLAELEPKLENGPSRDDILAMAIIRQGQGMNDAAIELLMKAVNADEHDVLARGMLVDQLMAAERFEDALPHASRLVEQLTAHREKMQAEMIERVRRDFVRSLPVEFQLRVTEELLADLARKWTLGRGFAYYSGGGGVQTMGYLRARLTLATIFAETERMDDARAIWQDLAPGGKPDVDSWTMLGSIAQLHDQNDLAFEFYEKALHAAKTLAGDPMMQQIYSSSTGQSAWYGEESIDSSFNKIVEAFAQRDSLVELYDFLRDTDQSAKARRIAEQYKLDEKLRPLYEQRADAARAEFQRSPDHPMNKSIGYFAHVAKLAEIIDRAGDWPKAKELYEQYLADFPDELSLLTTLGEVAEAQHDTAQAIEWEKSVIECKSRLTKQARQWMMRDLTVTPAAPRVLESGRTDPWTWSNRWRRNRWYYGSMQGQLERSPSWMRLAQLYLVEDNTIAAADAMQRAVADAGGERQNTIRQVLELIQSRQLTSRMLPVLRNLAVYSSNDERVQLAFAEALEANERKDVAIEVCNRMLRRGVSDLGVLGEVRRKLQALDPTQAPAEVTLASLEAELAADPANLKNRLRLAKAYYYSLNPDKALEIVAPLAAEAPHLDDVHALLVEIYTLQGDSDKLIEALNTQISRTTDDDKRRSVRWRLVDELLASGKTEEALNTVKELGDPRDPYSYQRIGLLLQYFGRHDEAIAAMEQSQKSQSRNPWDSGDTGYALAKCLIIKGDVDGAIDKIMTAIDEQARSQMQYGGVWALYDTQNNPFQSLQTSLVLHPELAAKLKQRIEERHQANPKDPQATKLLMQMHRALGRPDLADALLEQMVDTGVTDQGLMAQLIDRAVRRKDFAKAIKLAETFISQQPKPQLPPGTPPQYAGMMAMQSPRVFMVCKLADVYWDMGQRDKAMETYRQIVDDKIEETKTAYASICAVRNRVDEAKQIVDEALAKQQVKPANLLQFRAFIAALEGQPEQVFDLLKESAAGEEDPQMAMYGRGGGGSPVYALGLLARRGDAPQLLDRFMAFMEERIAKNPHDWENYSNLASALHEMGRPREALQVLDRAAAINSLTLQSLQQRSQWIENRASIDELIVLHEKMIELTDRNVAKAPQAQRQIYMPTMMQMPAAPSQSQRDRLGDLLWDKGDQQRAEKVWIERMNAQQAATHIKLGQLYTKKFAYDKARASFERALELDPENAGAHAAMADLAYHAGDRRALLTHMVACFVQNRMTSSSQQAQARSGAESSWYEGLIPDRRMHLWAVELSRDPEIASYLAGETGDEAASGRLLLSLLTGNWTALEDELRRRIDAKTVDPLIWALWAQTQQRKGDWAEAARAWDYLRRTKLTTIADHREKLKLVLAGKQIKEAAAGTRQSQPNMPAQPTPGRTYYGGMNYNYGYWYGDAASDASRLAGIYIKLGQFDKAERLYLISSSGQNVQYTLPSLAALMWEQRARDRALELMRLSVLNSTDQNMVPQYAGMMAEAGRADAAIDLLVRGYRWNTEAYQQDVYASMWGGNDQQQLEQYGESSFSTALHDALRRSGKYDQIVKTLSAEAQSQPGDASLAKLIISLQIKGRQWEPLRESLVQWRKARPDDLAIKMEQLHVSYQLERWDEAMELLNSIKADAPQNESQWRMNEAFIALMRNDRAAAVAAAEAVIASPSTDHTAQAQQILTVLAAAEAYEPMSKYLESLRVSGEIDEAGLDALLRAYTLKGQWQPALDLAIEQFWKQPGAIEETSRWNRALIRVVRAAEAAGALNTLKTAEPSSAALLAMVVEGPAKALTQFDAIVTQQPDSVNALRGQIFAATLANDDAAALQANKRLIDLLDHKRQDLWYSQPTASLQRVAQRSLDQMSRAGTTGMAMNGAASQIQQAMQSLSANAQTIKYEELWRSHQRMQRDLLAATGETKALEQLLSQQVRSFTTLSQQTSAASVYYQGAYMPTSMAYGMPNVPQPGADETALARDWRIIERQLLARHHRLREVLGEFNQLKTRAPEDEWALAAEAAAALGNRDDAAAWQRQMNELRLNRLRSSDSPGQTQSNRYSWRWYGYGVADQTANIVRAALGTSTADTTEDDRSKFVQGAIDQLWETALIDPEVEQRLLRSEPDIGPGWGATQTFIQLVNYYRGKQQFDRVIALFERANQPEELLRSNQLGLYVEACLKSNSGDRFEKLLNAARDSNLSLENDVLLARLVWLRKQNKTADADALEQQLISKCVIEPPNANRLDRWVDAAPVRADQSVAANQRRQTYSYVGGRRYTRWVTDSAFSSELATVTSLAQALGVRYQPRVDQGDLTIARIRHAYLSHGLYADADRLFDAALGESRSSRDRYTYLWQRAYGQDKAGKAEAAASAAREAEKLILAEIASNPTRADWHYQLANVYQTRAYGRDYAKALQAYQTARKLDPAYDPGGLQAVHCLYKLGRHKEAWAVYREAMNDGRAELDQEPAFCYAALAAQQAGDADAAPILLRRALHKYPLNPLLANARELIHEQQ